jgi:hypothetical protein
MGNVNWNSAEFPKFHLTLHHIFTYF